MFKLDIMAGLSEAHLWYLFPGDAGSEDLVRRYYSTVTDDELKKINRYIFDKDRLTCLLTRALTRFALSHYLSVHPSDLRFTHNRYGKPQVNDPSASNGCKFNISHTAGLICLAVAPGFEVGVDVESLDRKSFNIDVAKRFFSTAEFDLLQEMPEKDRKKAFLRLWTLKEAYIKARGMGLSIPLDSFSFTLGSEKEDMVFHCGSDDEPENWQFFNTEIDDSFQLSLAINTPSLPRFRIRTFCCVPFSHVKDGLLVLK